ncbi:hypothetical protein KO02_13405 [Sphingobacterium sp. ML3W]|uniref:type IIL restriction-modification enzyme MmeI n=1 Tax=Sphingobacterium sp. ML3W TaxID=1538644 RepID=UPI0004F6E6FF|nr:type IIL restriction-modification enzyme MmeI [Sphingobacterium sp. ML3W]AIM37571.1 hypothetical protein KO02_13405 [Sphingobacterium sp. ML3W]
MNRPIFSKQFLAQYLKDFRLATQTDIFRKKDIIDTWIKMLESHRLDRSKEEETKSRFILEIFGDVLGFNYKNPSNWLIREELKTSVDATKPDAALGRFKINETGIENDVHVVIEIKDSKTSVDKPQNRAAFKISPVDQAFLYASKVGGNCKWVVVSNFTEIRFYHQSSQGEYQSYQLDDLRHDDVLREFLFLFHKDRLTNTVKSATDKLYELREKKMESVQSEKHIIDQMYEAIYKFEGLDFVDPNFLCNVYPFNTSEDYVWHYNKGRLLALNPDITDFLKEITTSGEGVLISEELTRIIEKKKIVEARQKIEYIFEKLHQFRVEKICAPLDIKALRQKEFKSLGYSLRHFEYISEDELVIVPTGFGPELRCECINCSFRKLDFDKYITKLKQDEQSQTAETLDLAYGHYLISTDNFKKSYFLYKNVDINTKGREDKKIQYFLSKINQLYLLNLVSIGIEGPQEKEILRDIKSIDLDRSIHDELEIYVDVDVRKYLIEIKENKLFRQTQDYIIEELDKLEKSNGASYDIQEIHRKYLILHAHIHSNKIIYDAFSDYQKLSGKVFKAIVLAYSAKKPLISYIPEFYFIEAMLYITTVDLNSILQPLGELNLSDDTKTNLVEKAKNLLTSYAREGHWGLSVKEPLVPTQLENFWFQSRFLQIFSNLFTILCKTELSVVLVETLSKPIFTFLKVEDFLGWDNLKTLGKFIQKYGHIFKPQQLHDLLGHAIGGTKYGYHKYDELIKSLCLAYRENYTDQPITDRSLVPKALANSMNPQGESDPRRFIYLCPIIEEQSRHKLLQEMDVYLKRYFDQFVFFAMLRLEIVSLHDDKYLEMYIDSAAKIVGTGFIGIIDGVAEYNNVTMINFIEQIYKNNIKLNKEQLKKFTNQAPFELWALNALEFDYEIFETDWLIAVNRDYILEELVVIPAIQQALEQRLSRDFNATLAQIYFKYFVRQ